MIDQFNALSRKLPTWVVYLLGLVPAPVLFWQGIQGSLGPNPVQALEHEYGLLALQLLIAGLCITPLRQLAGINLLRFRRALGVLAFSYVVFHLSVWLVLDMNFLFDQILRDLVKRWYITIGMTGFVLLLPLAITSNNLSLRKLGAMRWRKLHKLTYGAVLLGGLHYVILVKGWQLEPLLYLLGIILLLGLRLPKARKLKFA